MRRREFITALGVGATWPLVAGAQQTAIPAIGFLHIGVADALANSFLAAFRRGLKETGYAEGQNVTVEYRFAEFESDRLPTLAADLVHRNVALIFELGGGAIPALAAKAATSTIPIVLAFGSDPVKLGLAASLNRPGGNVTGVTFYTTELVSKRVELLCELLPQARRIAYLQPPPQLSTVVGTKQMEADALTTARSLGRQLLVSKVDSPQKLIDTFSAVINEHPDALLISSAPFFDTVEIIEQ